MGGVFAAFIDDLFWMWGQKMVEEGPVSSGLVLAEQLLGFLLRLLERHLAALLLQALELFG